MRLIANYPERRGGNFVSVGGRGVMMMTYSNSNAFPLETKGCYLRKIRYGKLLMRYELTFFALYQDLFSCIKMSNFYSKNNHK